MAAKRKFPKPEPGIEFTSGDEKTGETKDMFHPEKRNVYARTVQDAVNYVSDLDPHVVSVTDRNGIDIQQMIADGVPIKKIFMINNNVRELQLLKRKLTSLGHKFSDDQFITCDAWEMWNNPTIKAVLSCGPVIFNMDLCCAFPRRDHPDGKYTKYQFCLIALYAMMKPGSSLVYTGVSKWGRNKTKLRRRFCTSAEEVYYTFHSTIFDVLGNSQQIWRYTDVITYPAKGPQSPEMVVCGFGKYRLTESREKRKVKRRKRNTN